MGGATTGGGVTVGGAAVGAVAVVVIVWSAYEIVTYRPCHPSGPLTEWGEQIADHFFPIEDDVEEDSDEKRRLNKCAEIWQFKKFECNNSGLSDAAKEICLKKADADFVKCIGPENWPPQW